jgi:plasmid replication initiation protein/Zn ribbon nucleic-acid-binding protein
MKKRIGKGLALIKKANNLIEARYKFDIWETRLFLSVLGQIHKDDVDFHTYRIQYKDIIKTFGLTSNQSYDLLREGASSLMKKPLYANYEINGQHREKQYHIIRSIDYLDGKKEQTKAEDGEYIDVTIDPDMKPLLLQLREQGGFTFYELNNVVKLGVYPLRIYELLKQYQKFGVRKLEIDEMKMMFELTSEYPLFANFYQRVVEPAIKEINKFSDLHIYDVEKVKKGKKVVALSFRFNIKNKEEKKKITEKEGRVVQPNLFAIENIDVAEVMEPLIEFVSMVEVPQQQDKDELFLLFQPVVVGEFGVSPSVFFTILEKYDKEAIEKAIRITQRTKNEGKVKNVSGFFIEALRNGYTDQEEEKTLRKKERAEDEQKKRQLKADLQEDLENLELTMKQRENTVIRQLVTDDETAREKAIEKAKILLLKNPYYKNAIAKKGYDLETLDIQTWREDEVLRELVKEGFKALFPAEFEYLKEMRERKRILEKQIKEL